MLELRLESDFLNRVFGGRVVNVTRVKINEKLREVVGRDGENDVNYFVRLYILFVFNCILFPMSNYSTPRFLLPYVDDLNAIGLYAWGDAAYNFLLDEMRMHSGGTSGTGARKRYFDGCAVGLMVSTFNYVCKCSIPHV